MADADRRDLERHLDDLERPFLWVLPWWVRFWFRSPTLRRLKLLELVAPEAVKALEFYADPGTYFAISLLVDRPCGAFADDGAYFDENDERCSEDDEYARWRPGETARKALGL